MEVNRPARLFLRQACETLFVSVQTLLLPTAAAATLGAVCSRCHWPASPWFWVAGAPVLYFAWLVLFLVYACLETTLIAPFFARPGRFLQKADEWPGFQISTCWALYNRFAIVGSLPLVPVLVTVPLFNRLVLRAYSPRISLGRDVRIGGVILDPDITRIGSAVVLGMHCRLVAHSYVRTSSGDIIYQSAPIVLGNGCTIGGGAQVEMGAQIGNDSIIERFSHVLPFTIVPPGEIWGGNPAVFHGKRDQVSAADVAAKSGAPFKNESAIRQLVADALNLPLEQISADSGTHNCVVWDSLGKMAIAAATHSRFGIQLPPEKVFALNSVRDVADALAGPLHWI